MKHHFSYFFRQGAGNMFTHGFMSFAAVGITVACLIVMGTFSLITYNANENLKELQRENAVVAFVDDNVDDAAAQNLYEAIESVEGVKDCTFVSRQEARDNYVAQFDENDLYSELSANVFRHRYVIHVQEKDQTRIGEIAAALKEIDGIAKVRADETISNGFITVRNIVGVVSVALIAILLIVSIFIISNTIKLTTFDRRDEIAVMKMVGATNSFIRWPFVFEGMLLGLCGAVAAFALQWFLYGVVSGAIMENDTLQLVSITAFDKICGPVAAAFVLAGLIVGVGGSLMAIRRFLRV